MQERARQRLCRAAFFAVAVFPCIGIVGFAGWRRAFPETDALRTEIRQSLGCAAEWESLEYSAPGVMRLRGLRLQEPRGGAVLAEFDQLTLSRADGTVHLSTDVARIPRAALPSLWQRLRYLDRTAESLQVSMKDFDFRIEETSGSPGAPIHVRSVRIDEKDGERRYVLRFSLPGEDDQPAPELIVVSRADETYQFVLDTRGASVPIALAARLWPKLALCGTKATFRGSAQCNGIPESSLVTLQGTLAGLDLAALTEHTTQKLTGEGTLVITEAKLLDGKLYSASGTLSADDGLIGHGLLSDLSGFFQLRTTKTQQELTPRDGELAYSTLRLRFALNRQLVVLQTVTDPKQPLLRDKEGKPLLAVVDESRPAPLSTLIRILYPTSDLKLAASVESWWLADWLPLPAARDLRPSEASPATRAATNNPVRRGGQH